MRALKTLLAFAVCQLVLIPTLTRGQDVSKDNVLRSMKLAASFFRNQVARHGGYVYFCSEDLKQRWGEGKAGEHTIFVQPPATPSVGESYLKAFEVTGDQFYLDAATETAEALVNGQLQSGGWTQVIHFQPPESGRMGDYRNRRGGSWNNSSLDDDQTQAALRFLMRTDSALQFKNQTIHEATIYGLNSLLGAQFPNGAFPQVWSKPAENHPVLQANYPDYDWRTEGRIKEYWDYYTLNDGLAGTVLDTLIVAHQTYGEEKFKQAIIKLGDFLIAAQMPEPQPAWCQQYNYQMQPMWARKFEPPAITGGESQDAMETLIRIASYSADKRFLEPIPTAVKYLEKYCLLPDGQFARYYELRTNRPLYMTSGYELTYDDQDVPKHYGWKVGSAIDRIKRDYLKVSRGEALDKKSRKITAASVMEVLKGLDSEGRWVDEYSGERLTGQPKFPIGFRFISSATFNKNIALLCAYLEQ